MCQANHVSRGLINTGENLFNRVLVNPALENAENPSSLHIISGYAEPELVRQHAARLNPNSLKLIDLIIGMTGHQETDDDGQLDAEEMNRKHLEYREMVDNGLDGIEFRCRYTPRSRWIHSKVYVWVNNNVVFRAFCGSVNYTLGGFGGRRQQETVCEVIYAGSAKEYFDLVAEQARDTWEEAMNS